MSTDMVGKVAESASPTLTTIFCNSSRIIFRIRSSDMTSSRLRSLRNSSKRRKKFGRDL